MARRRDFPLVDIFPYKIKNVNNFYFRDHPINLNPDLPAYKEYWKPQIKDCIVGKWINDNGTWVFMFPALYWYVNIVKIVNEGVKTKTQKGTIPPKLRDNEWIYFTYDFITDGFSGFKGDKEVTCNFIVGKIQAGEEVDRILLSELDEDCYKENGELKRYIDPWEYLTRYYLLENPAKEPLGEPLYNNLVSNGLVITSRGLGKSLMAFPGKAYHLFTFNGVRTWQEYRHIEDYSCNIFTGSPDERKMSQALKMIKKTRQLLPGSYSYVDDKGKRITRPGPFYTTAKGSWTVGKEVSKLWKGSGGSANDDEGSGTAMAFKSMISSDAATAGRYKYVLVEEIGLLKFAREFYGLVEDSMVVGVKTGKMWGIGTGGDIEAIQDTKYIFHNISQFEAFGIPNYWNPNSKTTKIPLFIPIQYKDDRYKDANGNTILEEAHEAALRLEEKKYKGGTSEYKVFLMNNPFIPDHVFYTSTHSVLPSEEAAERVAYLETGIWKEKARIGWIKDDKMSPNGVKFVEDPENYRPILDYINVDPKKMQNDEQRGAIIQYEPPQYPIEKNLYKVVIDQVFLAAGGTSFNCAWVYKGIDGKGGMQDNIVMEWTGRINDETLDKTFELFLKMALLYGAKIFPEANLDEFIKWLTFTKKLGFLLQEEAYLVEQQIFSNYKRRRGVGWKMRGRKDKLPLTCDRWQKEWLLREVIPADLKNGTPAVRLIDTIYSIRYLNEVASYNDDGNFDNISVGRGLMLWLRQEELKQGHKDEEEGEYEEIYEDSDIRKSSSYEVMFKNSSFLDG